LFDGAGLSRPVPKKFLSPNHKTKKTKNMAAAAAATPAAPAAGAPAPLASASLYVGDLDPGITEPQVRVSIGMHCAVPFISIIR
jgi:hypothetical protein